MADRKLLLAIQMQTAQAIREMEALNRKMGSLQKSTKETGNNFFAAQVAFAAFQKGLSAVTHFVEGSIKRFIEQERVEAQLNQTLKSTGYAAGLTAEQLKAMARGLQDVTAYGDEAVIGAENLLLTFTNIGKDIFPTALETVLNMSTALGQDLKSSAIQLGKALQDPILGVTALRRVGVNFNEAQTEVIKKLVKTGHAAEAQKLILKELEAEFGGSARAARDTLGGSLEALKNSFGDLQESLGAKFAPALKDIADNLIPKLEGPMNVLGDTLAMLFDTFTEILPIITEVAASLTPLLGVILEMAVTLWKSLQPAFEQIARIIKILTPIIEKLFQTLSPLIEIFADVFATALEIVADLLEQLSPILNVLLDALKPIFEILKPIVHILGEVLKPILEVLILPLKLIFDAINAVSKAIDDSLHHWENLAKANEQAIDGLEKTREQYERMESAIKNGSMKNSELLKTQKELIEKYPELRGAIDLVNGSYEDNVKTINQAILKRKEEQIHLLEQTKKEIEANKKRAESWLWLNQINQVFNPAVVANFNLTLDNMGKRINAIGGKGGELDIARQQLEEFKREMDKPPKDKGKSGGGTNTVVEETKKTYGKVVEIVTGAYNKVDEEQLEMLKAHEKRIEETEKLYEKWANVITGGIGGAFSAMGEALATGEDAWAAFSKAAIQSIAGVLDALAQEFFVRAAAAAVEAIFFPPKWAEAAGWTAAGAAASLASGLVRGFAGSFAEGGSFQTNGPSMMMVGDNSGGVEQVTVTPVSSNGANAGDIVITQPFIINVDAGPIYRGMLKATRSGIGLVSKKAVVS